MRRIENAYESTKCCQCSRSLVQGEEIYYDPTAVRGKRGYCIPCGTTRKHATTAGADGALEDTAAELARLKAELARKEREEAKTSVPTVQTVNADPLAQAIAKAVEPLIAGKLDEARVRDLIADYMTPPVQTIRVETPKHPEGVEIGRQHKQFSDLLTACNARTKDGYRLNVWMTGPAGTGKTSAAKAVAKALSLEYASTGSLTEMYKVFGHISPGTGQYIRTLFRERWEHGGVFLFDDFDASDPVAAVEANEPLANGTCAFLDGMIPRHPDTIIILTANTWGHGATNDYVGRMKQDGAFLDRFVFIDWGIDEQLERDIVGNDPWVKRVQQIRANVRAKGLKVLVTPRASIMGEALLRAGLPQATVETMTLRKSMTADQWSSVC